MYYLELMVITLLTTYVFGVVKYFNPLNVNVEKHFLINKHKLLNKICKVNLYRIYFYKI